MNCRHCAIPLSHTFLDLGHAPPSNAYLTEHDLSRPEVYYPLKVKVCDRCWLVQTEDYTDADKLFTSEYAYFSSTSKGWVAHAERFVSKIIDDLNLDGGSFVIEVACNDGYLLRNFVSAGIPCVGVEPTASTAVVAERIGIPVLRDFFGEELGQRFASTGKQADLIVCNNVFAHVPDINGFTRGLKAALKIGGTITLEFPHLMKLISGAQFDTVYHEHFSYLSLHTTSRIFAAAALRIWHVEELSTHGGSLRVYGCHVDDVRETQTSVGRLLFAETKRGLQSIQPYLEFQSRADNIKNELLMFLINQKREGKKIVAYGAAAKGNTLLNYAGVKRDLLPFVCDAAEAKQGKFMPGSHIPILPPDHLPGSEPDFVLILPWNIAREVKDHYAALAKRGVHFVTAVPDISVA